MRVTKPVVFGKQNPPRRVTPDGKALARVHCMTQAMFNELAQINRLTADGNFPALLTPILMLEGHVQSIRATIRREFDRLTKETSAQ